MKSLSSFFYGFVLTGLAFGVSSLFPQSSLSNVPDKGIVVAELFTSQSCSSCPAADKVMQDISKNENVITLSCHVTYWDHLHWKDTLSQKFCTARQKKYASYRDTTRVYTPQIIVNGHAQMIGSDRAKVSKAVMQGTAGGVKKITLMRSNEGLLEVRFPTLEVGKYRVSLLSYTDKHVQSIASGENRGRTVTYTNSVQGLRDLGTWNGAARFNSYDISSYKQAADGVVVLAQDTRTGHIHAAGRLRF